MSSMKPSRRQAFATAFASVCSLFAVRKSAAQCDRNDQPTGQADVTNRAVSHDPVHDSCQVTHYEYRPDENERFEFRATYTIYDAQGRVVRCGG